LGILTPALNGFLSCLPCCLFCLYLPSNISIICFHPPGCHPVPSAILTKNQAPLAHALFHMLLWRMPYSTANQPPAPVYSYHNALSLDAAEDTSTLSRCYTWRLKIVLALGESLRDAVSDMSESGTVHSAPCAALLSHGTRCIRTDTHTHVSQHRREGEREERGGGGGGRRRRGYGEPELTTERCH
jgi:hypothetical protein